MHTFASLPDRSRTVSSTDLAAVSAAGRPRPRLGEDSTRIGTLPSKYGWSRSSERSMAGLLMQRGGGRESWTLGPGIPPQCAVAQPIESARRVVPLSELMKYVCDRVRCCRIAGTSCGCETVSNQVCVSAQDFGTH